jgi:cobalt-precorrin-7 (C5)-methyltransferase
MAVKKIQITIAGCGPGGPDYITAIARREIEAAEVLAGAPRLLACFPGIGAERIPVGADIEQALDRIAACRGRRIVVLVTGDPGLCSFAQPVIRRFGFAACRVIPGVSAIQAAYAAVGSDWTGARILTAHSRVPDTDPATLVDVPSIAVLAGHEAARPWFAAVARQLGSRWRAYLCQDLTLPGERIRQIRQSEWKGIRFPPRSVILFIRRGGPA